MPWASQLSAFSLASLAEFNGALQESAQTDPDNRPQDDRKEAILNQLLVEIENLLDRQIVTRGSLTEFHSLKDGGRRVLYVSQYPLIGATNTITVHEDPNWEAAPASAYGASALLVENVDYFVIKLAEEPAPYVKLYRLGRAWATGYRRIKVAASSGCGYANTAAVPTAIKGVCLEVAARAWRDRSKGEIGLLSRTDGMGTITRQLPALLLEEDKRKLRPYRREDLAPTWERAA